VARAVAARARQQWGGCLHRPHPPGWRGDSTAHPPPTVRTRTSQGELQRRRARQHREWQRHSRGQRWDIRTTWDSTDDDASQRGPPPTDTPRGGPGVRSRWAQHQLLHHHPPPRERRVQGKGGGLACRHQPHLPVARRHARGECLRRAIVTKGQSPPSAKSAIDGVSPLDGSPLAGCPSTPVTHHGDTTWPQAPRACKREPSHTPPLPPPTCASPALPWTSPRHAPRPAHHEQLATGPQNSSRARRGRGTARM